MKDISILHLREDIEEADALRVELLLLGVRLSLISLPHVKHLARKIDAALEEHSAVLLFVTKSFAEAFLASDEELGTRSASVLPLTFGVGVDQHKELAERLGGLAGTRSRSIRGYSMEVLRELGSTQRKIELAPARTFAQSWESPLFLYQKTEGFDDVREILVDVTWSAKPIQSKPARTVLAVFREAFAHIPHRGPKYKILDFGAGKLRYTLFWLSKRAEVTAVDYPEPFERPTAEIETAVKKAKRFRGFDRVVYPSQLLALDSTYDAALLINVVNVVPDPLERLFILAQCHARLADGGYLVVFNTYGDVGQLDQADDQITDGGCTRQKGRKTFYKNMPKEELVRICELMGFELSLDTRFARDKNVACLFRKSRSPILDIEGLAASRSDVLGRKVVFGEHDSERVIADILDSEKWGRLGDFLSHSLDATASGKQGAYRYEDVIHRVIEYTFREHFRGSTLQQQYEIQEGRQRIDIKADWRENTALKTVVKNDYEFKSSWVPIECKNYSWPLTNPEFAQMVERCHRRYRQFGMIFCRDLMDPEKVLDQCASRLRAHGYLIIVLDDVDVRKMLHLTDRALEVEEESGALVSYLQQKIEAVVVRAG